MSTPIQLVTFDMAGTTIRDNNEVASCFFKAIETTGLTATPAEVNAMMGWSKRKVFETLWTAQLGAGHPAYATGVESSYQAFTSLLEAHYRTQPIVPAEGALEVFAWCRQHGIKIALNTGFYRVVTDIILERLGWLKGLNEQYIATDDTAIIDCSIASSDVTEGRPAPDMIFLAMEKLGITDPKAVINIGDTPSDLEAGLRAGVKLSLAVANGTHSRSALEQHPHDGILESLHALIPVLH
jgi:phosphonatase-like hydrolase